MIFGRLILVDDSFLLSIGEHEQFGLLLSCETLVSLSPAVDLTLKDRKERVILVLHHTFAKSCEGRLKELILDLSALFWVSKLSLELSKRISTDGANNVLKIGLLIALDTGKHRLSTVVEVSLDVLTRVGKEIDKGSLLDEIVFVVDANVFHLFFGGNEVIGLNFLSSVSPLSSQLLSLVTRVNIVEVGELGSDNESEMADLRDTQVECDHVLMMEDKTSDPLVMMPGAHTRKRSDRTDVEEHEDEATSRLAEGLVVRRYLFRSDSIEQSLHIVVV